MILKNINKMNTTNTKITKQNIKFPKFAIFYKIFYKDIKENDEFQFRNEKIYKDWFFFTDKDNIHRYINQGYYIVEIIIPNDAKMIQVSNNSFETEYICDKIILGKQYDLFSKYAMDTFNFNSLEYFNGFLDLSCENGNLEMVKLMIEKGVTNLNNGLYNACEDGHSEIVEFLLKHGADDVEEAL